ncbi:heterokaryon incompatibility protein-domain-containing protein [Podospora aff. communis PSN243]|uniref:Heterokaryon incompatibility protein-domain-containing protein n=1 Tax=Podospora aff. communis PSN243 TaxID=3040156 RepID=A0AAV9G205_9PEZI|nr:heterokaryon incompatibility protein-domain-containing protein [Podospora aff. communis PSN243]
MAVSTAYEYCPLTPGQFRILHVFPGADDEPLRGDLRIETFDDGSPESETTPFTALSYVWGTAEKTRVFHTYTGSVAITESLYSFLIRLRHPDTTQPVWADAICINQNDPSEKGDQVALMGRIYSSAERVICDLGTDNQDGDKALDLLDSYWMENIDLGASLFGATDVHTAEQLAELLNLDLPPRRRPHVPAAEHRSLELPPELPISFDYPAGRCVRRFLSRPWFRRLWVVQEFVLGRHVELLCGARRIPWGRLAAGVLRYGRPPWPFNDPENEEESLAHYQYPYLFMALLRIGRSEAYCSMRKALLGPRFDSRNVRADFSLLDSIFLFIQRETGFPRDRYFAMLSLADDAHGVADLVPDYSSPIEDVVCRFGRHMLRSKLDGGMALALAELPDQGAKNGPDTEPFQRRLPSWVPNFLSTAWADKETFIKQQNILFDAAGPTEFYAQFTPLSANEHLLHTIGCRVDVITAVSIHFEGPEPHLLDWQAHYTRLILSTLFFTSHQGPETKSIYAPTGEHTLQAIVRVMIASPPRHFAPEFFDIGFRLLHRDILLVSGTQSTQSAPSVTPPGMGAEKAVECKGAFVGSFWRSWTRKFAVTKHGYFCLLPRAARPTDEIWIIRGCKVPLVLRPSTDRRTIGMYQLVGHGFVHGIMHGEYMSHPHFKPRGVTLY